MFAPILFATRTIPSLAVPVFRVLTSTPLSTRISATIWLAAYGKRGDDHPLSSSHERIQSKSSESGLERAIKKRRERTSLVACVVCLSLHDEKRSSFLRGRRSSSTRTTHIVRGMLPRGARKEGRGLDRQIDAKKTIERRAPRKRQREDQTRSLKV